MSRHAVTGAQIDQLMSAMMCEICETMLSDPVALPCGHVFCLECIHPVAHAAKGGKCPECTLPLAPPQLRKCQLLEDLCASLTRLHKRCGTPGTPKVAAASPTPPKTPEVLVRDNEGFAIPPKPFLSPSKGSATPTKRRLSTVSPELKPVPSPSSHIWSSIMTGLGSPWDVSYRELLKVYSQESLQEVREIDDKLKRYAEQLSEHGICLSPTKTPILKRKHAEIVDETGSDSESVTEEEQGSQRQQPIKLQKALAIVVATSGLAVVERAKVSEICEEKGIGYTEANELEQAAVTHLVTFDPAPRTLKYCLALALGLWIVDVKWLQDSGSFPPDEISFEVKGDTGKASALTLAPLLSRKAKASRSVSEPTFTHNSINYASSLLLGASVTLLGSFNIIPKPDVALLCTYLGAVILEEPADDALNVIVCEGKTAAVEARERKAELKTENVIEIRSLLGAVCKWSLPLVR